MMHLSLIPLTGKYIRRHISVYYNSKCTKRSTFFFKSSVIEEQALCEFLNNEKYNLDRVQQLLSNFISDLNILNALEKKHLKSLILVILTYEVEIMK